VSQERETQLLVALQDLEQMIREAEDKRNREALEKMGFPVTGVEELRKAQKKLEDKIAPQVLGRYRKLTTRSGRAVVPVVDGTCTGCFTNVPAIFTSSVNAGKVIYCETCGRVLFWP
jgi:predicted  nucleic acid-binding Zn-ribbon protein